MQKVVVFLGPSLPDLEKARQILGVEASEDSNIDVDIRPPAKRGDIFRAANEGAELICLIDGVFFQDCSVAHKEVLYALDHGVKVIGASSMGALRASELDIYGMEGVGEIYRAYKSGELISDDEVALTFDPISFEPMSEPLVNIRYNLKRAIESGIIDEKTKEALFKSAVSLYFPNRTYDKVILACIEAYKNREKQEKLENFRTFINNSRADLKMEDAIAALGRAREILNEG